MEEGKCNQTHKNRRRTWGEKKGRERYAEKEKSLKEGTGGLKEVKNGHKKRGDKLLINCNCSLYTPLLFL